MINLLKRLLGIEDRTFGVARSGGWSTFRKNFITGKVCAVCARHDKLEVHHIIPFWQDPSQELNPLNCTVLCQGLGTRNDHLYFGHLGKWASWNVNVIKDSVEWNNKIKTRP